ncbi:MAG: hypothetical protein JWM57_1993 [Phycisphaerales bacterium]|nr:hypothetical protein [Phycisphaerales bacterium]
MSKQHQTFSVCILSILGMANAAQAALIDQGITTRDTTTGRVWLDVTQSKSRSYLDVTANFSNGGDFSGYRYATEAEVLQLWTDAGITPTDFRGGSEGVLIRALQNLVGITQPANGNLLGDATFGINGDMYSTGYRRGSMLSSSGTSGTAILQNGGYSENGNVGNFGSWLVQVPEPTVAATSLVFAGLTLRRLRSRRV